MRDLSLENETIFLSKVYREARERSEGLLIARPRIASLYLHGIRC